MAKTKKTATRKKKSNAGRPPIITAPILHKLKQAFLEGCSDEEACLFAGISPRAFYNYQKENEEFVQEKEQWKQNPFLHARKSIFKGIKKDPDLALKFMERKKKDEFSTRTDFQGNMTFNRMPLIAIKSGIKSENNKNKSEKIEIIDFGFGEPSEK